VIEYFAAAEVGGGECHMVFHFRLMPRIFMSVPGGSSGTRSRRSWPRSRAIPAGWPDKAIEKYRKSELAKADLVKVLDLLKVRLEVLKKDAPPSGVRG
jgi:hypothetical protein